MVQSTITDVAVLFEIITEKDIEIKALKERIAELKETIKGGIEDGTKHRKGVLNFCAE